MSGDDESRDQVVGKSTGSAVASFATDRQHQHHDATAEDQKLPHLPV